MHAENLRGLLHACVKTGKEHWFTAYFLQHTAGGKLHTIVAAQRLAYAAMISAQAMRHTAMASAESAAASTASVKSSRMYNFTNADVSQKRINPGPPRPGD
jgi:hypothetical protein